MTSRTRVLTAAATLALLAWAPGAVADEPTPSQSAPTQSAPTRPTAQPCAGVWVAVEGTAPRCAHRFDTGRAALESAGFALAEKSPGFLCQIDHVPDVCTVDVDAYWSYWQATRDLDGTWGAWTYSTVGYTQSHPRPGDAEGWVLGDGSTPPPALPVSLATGSSPGSSPGATPAPTHDAGSPAGALATAGVVALGGAALGGWWLRHRRAA